MTAAPSPAETMAEIQTLSTYFMQAEETIKSGGTVDMSGMETQVGAVCKKVQDSPPEAQRDYLPELTALLSRLDSCELAIRSMQVDLPEPEREEPHARS
ncbi:MAG: hypothetical protein PHW63_06910 [Alphaproteobacteria bacterium]|nr:hypothetical protein [Alphaproteobacteria bacterium]